MIQVLLTLFERMQIFYKLNRLKIPGGYVNGEKRRAGKARKEI